MSTNANTEDKKASLDLAAMMDETLDTIPEAPDFTNPPAGDYVLDVKECEIQSYNPKATPDVTAQRIRVTYTVVSTIALADPNEQPVPDESLFSETFMGTLEGIGYYKKAAKAQMNVESLDGVVLRDILATHKGSRFNARIATRKTPKPGSKTEFYENISIRVVPPVAS